jgi:hypothetical protein
MEPFVRENLIAERQQEFLRESEERRLGAGLRRREGMPAWLGAALVALGEAFIRMAGEVRAEGRPRSMSGGHGLPACGTHRSIALAHEMLRVGGMDNPVCCPRMTSAASRRA